MSNNINNNKFNDAIDNINVSIDTLKNNTNINVDLYIAEAIKNNHIEILILFSQINNKINDTNIINNALHCNIYDTINGESIYSYIGGNDNILKIINILITLYNFDFNVNTPKHDNFFAQLYDIEHNDISEYLIYKNININNNYYYLLTNPNHELKKIYNINILFLYIRYNNFKLAKIILSHKNFYVDFIYNSSKYDNSEKDSYNNIDFFSIIIYRLTKFNIIISLIIKLSYKYKSIEHINECNNILDMIINHNNFNPNLNLYILLLFSNKNNKCVTYLQEYNNCKKYLYDIIDKITDIHKININEINEYAKIDNISISDLDIDIEIINKINTIKSNSKSVSKIS